MFTFVVPLVLVSVQQVDPAELQKAIQQDAASGAAASAPAPAPATAAPDIALSAQQNVQRPGSTLLNPALSVILDSTFGYYGKSPADFDQLGLPPAGDDPSVARQGFGIQEIELAASAAID